LTPVLPIKLYYRSGFWRDRGGNWAGKITQSIQTPPVMVVSAPVGRRWVKLRRDSSELPG